MKTENNTTWRAASILLAILLASVAPAAVIYVDASATGANNGTSWTDAWTNLQLALDQAVVDDEIRVAQGIYRPAPPDGDRDISFVIPCNIQLLGGFAGVATPDPDERDIAKYKTILSGDLNANDAVVPTVDLPTEPTRAENSYHVVTALDWKQTTDAVLDGLVITGGNANGSVYQQTSGGGVEARSTLHLANCVLENNSAVSGGGCASPGRLTGCLVRNNYAQYGGGLCAPQAMSDCIIEQNVAMLGGAIDSPRDSAIYRDCIIRDNTAAMGGAIAMTNERIVLVRCDLSGNHATEGGGAVYIASDCTCWSELRFYQCRLWANSTDESGGAIHIAGNSMVYLHSTMLWGNQADSDGGALYCNLYAGMREQGLCSIVNCTFASNTAGNLGGAIKCLTESGEWFSIVNTILWANSDKSGQHTEDAQIQSSASMTGAGTSSPPAEPPGPVYVSIDYCCVQGWTGALGGTANTGADPMFVDIDGPDGVAGNADDDMHLRRGSTLINAGINPAYGGGTPIPSQDGCDDWWDVYNGDCRLDTRDLDGNLRITDAIVDIGAYEYVYEELGTIYVDADAVGADDGSSWPNAFNSLVDALAAASAEDEIRVAQGVYYPDRGAGITPGDRNATFHLVNNVTLRGGYAGLARPNPDARDIQAFETILSGDLLANDIAVADPCDMLDAPTRSDNSLHVVTATDCDRTAVLDGFTITAGNANGAAEVDKHGGGIYNGRPTIDNCLITGNSTHYNGGGAFFGGTSHTEGGIIRNTVISDNAARSGGGIFGCIEIADCLISGNVATQYGGGGISFGYSCDTTVTDCEIRDNSAAMYGGGMSIGASNSKVVFTRCTIACNSVEGEGGAVAVDGCTCGSEPVFRQCRIIGNHATGQGGGVYNYGYALTTLDSCIIVGNEADDDGGGICNEYSSGSSILNCTVVSNSSGQRGGGISYSDDYSYEGHDLANTILWNNSAASAGTGQIYTQYIKGPEGEDMLSVEYCCIQGLPPDLQSNGNIGSDPDFLDMDGPDQMAGTADDNLHLRHGSPCIDAGDNSVVDQAAVDLDGNDRIVNTTVDMGAYERQIAGPDVTFVDRNATGANNGSSWANAYNCLRDALADATANEIRVARGVYKPDQGAGVSAGDRDAAFNLPGSRVLKGGYAGLAGPDPDERDINKYQTILSGDLADDDAEVAVTRDLRTEPTRAENSRNILTVEYSYDVDAPVIEGFTITGARESALRLDYDDAVVTDCTFTGNASEDGAAVKSRNSRTILTRCSFIGNAADGRGGAVYIDGCSTCRSMYGAFVDCLFVNNYAGGSGGGIYSASVTLTTCINSLFVGNTAGGNGAAVYDDSYLGTHLVNCTIAGNNNAAVYIDAYGFAALTNCILWNNVCGTSPEPDRSFQIAWNQDEPGWPRDNKPVINYCCIEGYDDSLGGIGNFSADPCFVSPGSWDSLLNYTPGDYNLTPDSPCLDSGDPGYVAEPLKIEIPPGYYFPSEIDPNDYIAWSTETDLAGSPRVAGARVDMGSYELHIPRLIAHWKLDETDGNVAFDSAGNSHGTLNGGPLWQPDGGSVDGALLFDGENDFVNCGNDPVFDVTGEITVAAWVKINSVNMDWQTVISKGDSAWRLSTANSEMKYHFAVTGGPPWNYINGDVEVQSGQWHHVCGTYDGANLRLYIDGQEDPAGPVPESNGVTTDDYDVLIGENAERTGRCWDGMIDDVRIYNYALSPADVARLVQGQQIFYVDASVSGTNDGLAWKTAFYSLQDALAVAQSGDEIRVAAGVYTPDDGRTVTFFDRTATFQLINGVTIRGGYAGQAQAHPDKRDISAYETILSGDLMHNDGDKSDNSRHVVTANGTDRTAVLDGFTISAGFADGIDSQYPFINNGAGMYNENASPTVLNCTFTDNIAVLFDSEYGGLGAAMYNHISSPLVQGCTFTRNDTAGRGAGMYTDIGNPLVSNCLFQANIGNAMSFEHEVDQAVVSNCTFVGNITGFGAGINCDYGSSPLISECTFIGNIAYWDGGGLRCYENCHPTITNCLFLANRAVFQNGGAISCLGSNPTVTNCTFSENTAEKRGGAIHCYRDSNPKVTNSILHANHAAEGNQIALRYDRPWPTAPLSNTKIIVSYCSIQGGAEAVYTNERCELSWGPGNIDVDPQFVQPGYIDANGTPDDPTDDLWSGGDYHLKSIGWRWDTALSDWTFDRVTSRCIDAGNPGADLADEPLSVPPDPENEWGRNIRINMGAYGGTAEASMSPYGWSVRSDLNNDGTVNMQDFAHISGDYPREGSALPGDLNRNGRLDLGDQAIFGDYWLTQTSWH